MSEPISSCRVPRQLVRVLPLLPLALVIFTASVFLFPHASFSHALKARLSVGGVAGLGVTALISTIFLNYYAEKRARRPPYKELPIQTTISPEGDIVGASTQKESYLDLPGVNAEVLDYLDIRQLGRMARVSRKSYQLVRRAIVRRAWQYGLSGGGYETARLFLKLKLEDARYLAKAGYTPRIDRNFFVVDREATLQQMRDDKLDSRGIQRAFECAIWYGGEDSTVVSRFLRYGADPTSAFYYGILNSDPKTLHFLRMAGMPLIAHMLGERRSALQQAVGYDRDKNIDYLLHIKEQRDFCNSGGSALHYAGNWQVAKLLSGGVDPNLTNQFGESALFRFVRNKSVLQQLIDAGADINIQKIDGTTPLMYAYRMSLSAYWSWAYGMEYLLKNATINVDLADVHGDTILHQLCRDWNYVPAFPTSLFQPIVQKSKNLNQQNNDGYAALHYAARSGVIKAMQLLLDGGADINLRAAAHTPLDLAINAKRWEAALYLLERGADVGLVTANGDGDTPLHLLCRDWKGSKRQLFQKLVQKSENLDAQNLHRYAALHYAAQNGAVEAIGMLLDAGANINLQSTVNAPLDLAINAKKWEAALYLLERGAAATIQIIETAPLKIRQALRKKNSLT